jgi:diguanylate cyclase (GGDEF)-like protein
LLVNIDFAGLTTDSLTGVLNYHYLGLRLDEELGRAARYGRPLAVVFVDVDDLGGINDVYDRAAGDFVLTHVAALLAGGVRLVDRVGRWAGGGFAMVLPETGAGAALGLAERMRADVAARRYHGVQVPGARSLESLRVTISCGVAAAPPHDGRGLMARSHQALHRAKRRGGNRCVVDD